MRLKTIFIFIILIFELVFSISFASEQDKDWVFDPKTSTLVPKYIGKIIAITGKISVEDQELKKGSKIYKNDIVKTYDKSYVVIELIDLSKMTLGPNSEFKVENWSYRTKEDREADFVIMKGQLRALVISKSKKDDQLKVKTTNASLGIRGTELMVNAIKTKNKEITQVALLEGSIHLEGDSLDVTRDLIPGDHAVISKSDKGTEHSERKLNEEEIKSFNGFILPEIPKLLIPIEIGKEELVSNSENISTQENVTENKSDNTLAKKMSKKEKTAKENLELLNALREQNKKR
jgi:hypothetical protein